MTPRKRKPKRKTVTNYNYKAFCTDCIWNKHDKGAQGQAALHTDQTGHTTKVSIKASIVYSKL